MVWNSVSYRYINNINLKNQLCQTIQKGARRAAGTIRVKKLNEGLHDRAKTNKKKLQTKVDAHRMKKEKSLEVLESQEKKSHPVRTLTVKKDNPGQSRQGFLFSFAMFQ